ncbi:hypothetical protein OPQ81_007030 [Rhizoctonia solani]|nr:hypothetical protein OPQ81_007030 [Rhizoctonia solani]
MTLYSVCEVLARKGSHRTAEAYNSRIRRHLQWFAGRSPLLAERLHEYNDTLLDVSAERSDSENLSFVAPRVSTQDPQGRHVLTRGFATDPKNTSFSDADRAAFIRFAAARPNGMEPIGVERQTDVWTQFAKMYPHHSSASWRTWHQHWQHDLKQAIEEYRKTNFR